MDITELLRSILQLTAWRMDPPDLFGSFHLLASALTAAAAVFAALRVMRSGRDPIRVLTLTGWFLVLLEVYKQLFLYYIVNSGTYDWWFFPFQLCSIPMYLCVLLPAVRGKVRDAFLTFMAGYTFVSSAAALIYPEDMLRSYVSLTFHGFLWHGILLFISIICGISGISGLSGKSFCRATALFLILCAAAAGINAAVWHHSGGGSYASMFYLNPFVISPQPVIGTIQKAAGIPAGLAVYISAVTALSGMLTCMFSCMRKNAGRIVITRPK